MLTNIDNNLIIIEIPNSNYYGEISYSNLYKQLEKSHKKITNENVVKSDTILPPFVSVPKKSPYDNIVEMLERKYHGKYEINDKVEAPEIDNAADMKQESEESNKKARKRSKILDNYDFEDPFIDDTETIDEVNAEIKSKRFKTK